MQERARRGWRSALYAALAVVAPALLGGLPRVASAASDTWVLDHHRSGIDFEVRHIVMKVRGSFTRFSGELDYDPADPTTARVAIQIDVGSIETDLPERDRNLRGPDLLDVDRYPTATFVSRTVSRAASGGLVLAGELTLHGVTLPVVLAVEQQGVFTDPDGSRGVRFEGHTVIKRRDFGITWNLLLDGDVTLIGDDVSLTLRFVGLARPPLESSTATAR